MWAVLYFLILSSMIFQLQFLALLLCLLLQASTGIQITTLEYMYRIEIPTSIQLALSIPSYYFILKIDDRSTTDGIFKEYARGLEQQISIYKLVQKLDNGTLISQPERDILSLDLRRKVSRSVFKLIKMRVPQIPHKLNCTQIFNFLGKLRKGKSLNEFAGSTPRFSRTVVERP
jgi:hypothetical protein